MDFGTKIKAARAALGWTQEQLAAAAGLSPQSIPNVEKGDNAPTARTQDKLTRALQKNGVILLDDGLRQPQTAAVRLTGKDWFMEVLDDAQGTLASMRNKEMLIFGSDHRVSPEPVIEGFRKLLKEGISLREIGEQGNTYIMGEISNYRWVPREFFENAVTVIYADKVVIDFGTEGMLIKNALWAQAERKKFELIWSKAEQPPKSTADVRY